MRKGLSANEIEKEMYNRRSFIDFLNGVLNLNPLARWTPEQARRHPFITGEPFVSSFIPILNHVSTSPSRSITTLHNGEVREIRGVRSRSSSNAINQISPPTARNHSMNLIPSNTDSNNSGYPVKSDDKISGNGASSSESGRLVGSFPDFRIQTHGIPSSNNQPNSASILPSSTIFESVSHSNVPHYRRLSINTKQQAIPARKDLDYGPYPGSYSSSQQSIPDYFAEHPRYGDFGERQRIPSRLPSAATSVDWEPFQDHDPYFGRTSRQPSISDMNWTSDLSSKIPSSPKTNRFTGFYGEQHRGSGELRSARPGHNRSLSHSSLNSLNNDFQRMEAPDYSGKRLSYGSYVEGQQVEYNRYVGQQSGQSTDTSSAHNIHVNTSAYPKVMAGSPSRGNFPISPRSSQTNLFAQLPNGYFKYPHKRISSLNSVKGFEGASDEGELPPNQKRSTNHGSSLSIMTSKSPNHSRLNNYLSPRQSQYDINSQIPLTSDNESQAAQSGSMQRMKGNSEYIKEDSHEDNSRNDE